MSAVVSDTSPINYLIQVKQIDLLLSLFGDVIIPTAVLGELLHSGAPEAVRNWASALPYWATVATPLHIDSSLDLDDGELEAIALAKQNGHTLLLMDERKGRKVAIENGLRTVSTLNILDEAAIRGLIDLEETITLLRATNFHVRDAILDELVSRARPRSR